MHIFILKRGDNHISVSWSGLNEMTLNDVFKTMADT